LPTLASLVRCCFGAAGVASLAACAGANGAHETAPPDAAAGTADAARDAAFEDAPDAAGSDAGDSGGWTLTWSDEFDGPDGSAPDPTKWRNDTGGGGWGNKELEYYTPGTANVVVQGGNLVVTATTVGAAQLHCWYGACQYTSARIKTEGLFSQQHGRFEARMQLPGAQGLWPAFWMMGNNVATVGWPTCGEIDVMELVGKQPSEVWGSLHSKNYDATLGYTLPAMARFADGFHTFAIEWDSAQIQFFVDDQLYETHLPAQATGAGGQWPFDQPFYVLLNVAVGGNWPGSPDSTTTFPQTMLVDYVRVYAKN
jgi:beta-glucanase (GH16 family)